MNESRFLCDAYTLGSRDNTSVTVCVIRKMVLDVALKLNYRVLHVCAYCCACLMRSAQKQFCCPVYIINNIIAHDNHRTCFSTY